MEVTDEDVAVRLSLLEKLGAVRGNVAVPRAAVRRVDVEPQPFSQVHGVRAPGTGIPGCIALGTWRRRGAKKDFVAVYRGRPALVVHLDEELAPYGRLVVSTEHAHELAELLGTGSRRPV